MSRLFLAALALLLFMGCDAAPDALRPPSQAELEQQARRAASLPQFALLTLSAQQLLRKARAQDAPLPSEQVHQLAEQAAEHLDRLNDYLPPPQHDEAKRAYRTLERLATPDLATAEAARLDEENFRRLNALLRDLRRHPRD